MNGILYDARKLKVYEDLQYLGELTGKSETYINRLWEGLLLDAELLKEFMYYLDNHYLLDEMKVQGYSLTDLYVWQITKFNMKQDLGKNTDTCNKEAMVLDTFYGMLELKENPELYIKRMLDGRAMDQL